LLLLNVRLPTSYTLLPIMPFAVKIHCPVLPAVEQAPHIQRVSTKTGFRGEQAYLDVRKKRKRMMENTAK
jgi:hypothetical protein